MELRLKTTIAAIKNIKIPEIPREVLLLKEELEGAMPNSATIISTIERNTTLSGAVLELANSRLVNSPETIMSVRDAVITVGFNDLYTFIVAAAIQNLFPNKGLVKDIMDNSVDIAFCMADIVEYVHVDSMGRNEAYLLGLFHNIGAMLLAAKDEATYRKIYDNSLSNPVACLKKEDDAFGTNHCWTGVIIGHKWRLPKTMIEAISRHHIGQVSVIKNDSVRAMVAMLKIANAMVSEVSLGAYAGDAMKQYDKDGRAELMIPDEELTLIRKSLITYCHKDSSSHLNKAG